MNPISVDNNISYILEIPVIVIIHIALEIGKEFEMEIPASL